MQMDRANHMPALKGLLFFDCPQATVKKTLHLESELSGI